MWILCGVRHNCKANVFTRRRLFILKKNDRNEFTSGQMYPFCSLSHRSVFESAVLWWYHAIISCRSNHRDFTGHNHWMSESFEEKRYMQSLSAHIHFWDNATNEIHTDADQHPTRASIGMERLHKNIQFRKHWTTRVPIPLKTRLGYRPSERRFIMTNIFPSKTNHDGTPNNGNLELSFLHDSDSIGECAQCTARLVVKTLPFTEITLVPERN